jgi:5'-3' exonuclease
MTTEDIFSPDPKKLQSTGNVEPYDHLIIDGGGLAVTAWAVARDLPNARERVSQGVYTCVTILSSLSRLVAANAQVHMVWDGYDNRRFRRANHPWYKFGRGHGVNRQEVNAIREQLSTLLEAIGIVQYRENGCEADDVVATLATALAEGGERTLIFSDDKDYLQLIDDNIHLSRRSLQGIILSPEHCELSGTMYGLDYLYIKAIMGDPGDNVRGLERVGETSAKALIMEIPDIFSMIEEEDLGAIEWQRLQPPLRKAICRAGRKLCYPPPLEAPEFAGPIAHRYGVKMHEVFLDDDECFGAAAREMLRCYKLVKLECYMEGVRPADRLEPNMESIPTILRKLGLGDEDDFIQSLNALAGAVNPRVPPPRTSGVRAPNFRASESDR